MLRHPEDEVHTGYSAGPGMKLDLFLCLPDCDIHTIIFSMNGT